MKVTFKYGIKTYSGTVDEMTFGSYRDGSICIGRKYVKPRLSEQNNVMASKMKNLSIIYSAVSSDYKEELKQYAILNAVNVPKHSIPPNAYAIWIRMMFLFAEMSEGHIELESVTYSDLQTLGLDILSISAAVENGYLDDVIGADELTANM
ncbi:MAG: hypothetical protein ABFC98_05265 [Candidatus Cloacimonas sp.]